MTSTLYWKPTVPAKENFVGDELKHVLRKKYDGNINATMDNDDIEYLTALLHAGIEDVQDLIDAIHKHERIEINEDY